MNKHGYNAWNVMLQEYIVSACTIKYLEQDAGKSKAENNINHDISAGFTEIAGLVRLLDNYENNREEFENIESFLLEIKKYFENYLTDLKKK